MLVRLAPNWTMVASLEPAASLYHSSNHHIIIIIDDNSNNVLKQLVVDQRKRTMVLVNLSNLLLRNWKLMTNGGPLSSRCTQPTRSKLEVALLTVRIPFFRILQHKLFVGTVQSHYHCDKLNWD
jgi:hypothetical protein